MKRSTFSAALLGLVALASLATIATRGGDRFREPGIQSITRVDNLEINGTTNGSGVITARSGVRLTTVTTGPILTSGTGDPNGAVSATQGSVFLRTDTAQVYSNTDGAMAWAEVGGSSGGNGLFAPVMSTVPTAASTGFDTWWYQFTGATYTDGELGPLVVVPTTAGLSRYTARAKTAPATPYTITVLMGSNFPLMTSAPTAGTYMGWGEAATGAANKADFAVLYPNQNSQSYRDQMTNATTTSSHTQLAAGITGHPTLTWWRLSDDGTTATISISATGDNASFLPILTVTKSGSFLGAAGYNFVLFGCVATAGSGMCQILSYEQN